MVHSPSRDVPRRPALGLIVFLALTLGAAAFGSRFEPGSWYAGLDKPWFTPPNAVFPVAWALLYLMIAISGWLAWRRSPRPLVVGVWGSQLALNALWSWIFFGLQRPGLALAEILLLELAIIATILVFVRASLAAALLLVPYWAWVGFALILNFEIWRLNP